MLSVVYKSPKMDQTYLFVERRDDFSRVPSALLNTFGTPKLAMIINLATKTHLGQADLAKVKAALTTQGYYLQLPPPPENLLKQFRADQV
ncbi:YcgL domain-containing protein [Oceanisphaera pacifica]|uniref:YcgL domain-containing protein J3U76_07245 n=1 Tax=Oceanisphaera pacifica TaxID=2818389 RepID=A0ABS3NGB2_9GAMM|nr:YcgL domain-containing protein [Oceanisphaera pacifica]MBO1519423.1 YcgL domain-containing protein [Oceanisphaera pacifica]